MKGVYLLIVLLWVNLPFKVVLGTTYYVKTNGNNGVAGTTWGTAWKTIGYAATNANIAGDVVIVSNGIYYEQVEPQHSGTAVNNITFKSFNPYCAVVDGASYCFRIEDKSYIKIEGFVCKNASSHGVYITGTSAFNNISNNKIYSNSSRGIYISGGNSDNNIISSNEIYGASQIYGIYINDGDNNIIANNVIRNNDLYGIYFTGSATWNNINNNRIYSNSSLGIYLTDDGSDNNTISSNEIYGTGQAGGIYISGGGFNQIIGNNKIYKNSQYGICLRGAAWNNINNNQIYSNSTYGIYLDGNLAQQNTISSNLIYGPNQNYGIYIDYGRFNQIIGNNKIYNNNYGISLVQGADWNNINNNRIYSNSSAGIYIADEASDNNTISLNEIYGSSQQIGINITNADAAVITNNNIYNNTLYGICLSGDATLNNIYNNQIYSNNNYGLKFSDVEQNIINNNQIHNNSSDGVYLENSKINVIKNNLIFSNSASGIFLDGGENTENEISTNECCFNLNGIRLNISSNNRVIFNQKIHNNSQKGIFIENADDNTIENNHCYSNEQGIYIDSSDIPSLKENICYGNISSLNSSGIYIKDTSISNSITDNNCYDNSRGLTLLNVNIYSIIQNFFHSNTNGIIVEGNSSDNLIIDNQVYSNYSAGIKLYGDNVDRNMIIENDMYNNVQGLHIYQGDINLAVSNTFSENKIGIYLEKDAVKNTNLNNIIYSLASISSNVGIYINGNGAYASNNFVKECEISDCKTGVKINYAKYNIIFINNIHHNTDGIKIESNTEWNIIDGNTTKDNSEDGICVKNSTSRNNVFKNGLIMNNKNGVRFDGCDNSFLVNNCIRNNTETGIYIQDSALNNKIQKNEIYRNGTYGIYIANTSGNNNLVINNTLYKNISDGINNSSANAIFKNLIVCSNDGIGVNSSVPITLTYSCVYDERSANVTLDNTCITDNPLLKDPEALWANLHLCWNSPCIGTGETNIVAGCMGAHTVYIKMTNNKAGNITSCTIFFTTSLADGSIPSDGKIYFRFDEDVTGLEDVNNVTTTSRWGGTPGTFTPVICYDPYDSFLSIVRDNNGAASANGDTENLILKFIYNPAIATNHTFELETRPGDNDEGYFEKKLSNDFRIIGYSNYYVCWDTGNDAWPGTIIQPWKTIQRAVKTLIPGDVVKVLKGANGIQYEQVMITNSGQPWGKCITYIADEPGTVTVIATNTNIVGTYQPFSFVVKKADWIRVTGFKCRNGTSGGIFITNSKHAIIRTNQCFNNKYGIKLKDSDHCSVRFSKNYMTETGIFVDNGVSNWLRGNECCSNSDSGIKLEGSTTESIIYENYTYSNTTAGIYLNGESVDKNKLWNNICYERQESGIRVDDGDFNWISANTNIRCKYGIYLTGTAYSNSVVSNLCATNSDYGIYFSGDNVDNNIIKNNTCSDMIPGQAIYISSGDNNIILENSILRNSFGIKLGNGACTNFIDGNFICSNLNEAINLNANSDYNSIRSNLMFDNNFGIIISDSSFNKIIHNNNIFKNDFHGIFILGISISNQIRNNIIYSNVRNGIYFLGNDVDENTITSNECFNNNNGISITNGDENYIIENKLFSNNETGVLIKGNNNPGYNMVQGNTVKQNNDGIRIETIHQCELRNNNVCSNAGYGIYLNTANNHHICSNTCFENDYGISITNGDNNIINAHNDIYNNSTCGIYFYGCATNIINNNKIYSNSTATAAGGIYIYNEGSDNNTIFSNEIYANQAFGIRIWHGNANAIINNVIYNNSNYGISLVSSTANNINKNQIYSNSNYGICISNEDSDNNTIFSNEIYGPGQSIGISIWGGDVNIITNNEIYNNNSDGIYLTSGASSNNINNNQIYSNSNYGIEIFGGDSDNNIISSNEIYGPGQDRGIYIYYGDANIIVDNKIHNNNSYGIYLYQGASFHDINNNHIYSNSSIGIYIHRDWSDNNTIFSNEIYGPNQDYGIYISAGDTNIITDNKIYNNDSHGIYLSSSAINNIDNNKIYSNSSCGIYIKGDYSHNNLIFSNEIYGPGQTNGIYIYNGDNNVITNNVIHNNDAHGIHLYWYAISNNINHNQIYSNLCNGIYIDYHSCDYNMIFLNEIHGPGQTNGIFIFRGSDNIITNNKIHNNDSCGIYFNDGNLDNNITHNQIYSNSGYGIYFSGATEWRNAIFANNVYGPNQECGIFICNGDIDFITYNKIYKNDLYGIYLTGNATGNNINNNKIYSNSNYGIYIDHDDTDQNIISSNDIYGPGQNYGISITNGDYNAITNNNKIYNSIYGIQLLGNAAFNNINNNRMYSNNMYGIFLDGQNVNNNLFEGNICFENINGIEVFDSQNNTFKSNILKFNITNGMRLSGNASGNVCTNNQVFSNSNYGIYLMGEDVDENKIFRNNVFDNISGIVINDGDNNIVSMSNLLYNNQKSGVYITGTAKSNKINENLCFKNTENGIFIDGVDADKNILCLNKCYENPNGIHIYEGDENNITQNLIYSNTTEGIYVEQSADNTIVQKNVSYANNRGLYIYSSAAPLISNNTFFNNNTYGVYLESTSGSVVRNLITKGNNDKGTYSTSESISVEYSSILDDYGLNTTKGTGSTNMEPLFKNTNSSPFDFHLIYRSRCIGKGKPDIVPGCMGAYTGYVMPDNTHPGATTTYTVYFTTSLSNGSIANSDYIYITYPLGFDCGNVTKCSTTSKWGGGTPTFSASGAGNVITIQRTGGNDSIAGEVENLIISPIDNINTPGTNYFVSIEIADGPVPGTGAVINKLISNDFAVCDTILSLQKIISSVELVGNSSMVIPGSTIFYDIQYDNDKYIPIDSTVIEDAIPENTVYRSNSVKIDNANIGSSITIEFFDGAIWQNEAWGNANPELVEKIRWTFDHWTDISPHNENDDPDACDVVNPDKDAGWLSYAVIIK